MSIAGSPTHRGRVRPSQPWRRYDVRRLRLDRLASDLELEADTRRGHPSTPS